ncbi:hypothetical protein N7516_006916 [Penicillium verrucosum]|uniref:uncharacterized protein n=1 Tax=Penicillium verrucosum TaxID=60171 RepID=UPI0025452C9E|nr:uncharacterized protein N7516_006916 [Penicillium verrucosum]KAJ5932427.1 hypothetical protein N7516_006916 [Penicillium verrucosum]
MVNPTRHDLHPDTKALGMVHRKPKGVPRSAIEMHSKECQDLGKCKYSGLADVFVVIFRKTEEKSSQCSFTVKDLHVPQYMETIFHFVL